MAHAPKGDFGAGQIELPHTTEALVVELGDLGAIGGKTAPPGAKGIRIVKPQHLDIGDPQTPLLNHRDDFRERRRIAAREDVFSQPRVGRAWSATTPDRVQDGNPVLGQELGDLAHELGVMLGADMLEHADRDDAIEAAGLITVVTQRELDPVCQARLLRALLLTLSCSSESVMPCTWQPEVWARCSASPPHPEPMSRTR